MHVHVHGLYFNSEVSFQYSFVHIEFSRLVIFIYNSNSIQHRPWISGACHGKNTVSQGLVELNMKVHDPRGSWNAKMDGDPHRFGPLSTLSPKTTLNDGFSH